MSAGGGRSVAVVGGGLAGITAALRLADAGCAVTLIEARPRLGGLTHSFRRNGLEVDNGQHVFLRCCTSYRALLDRLDVTRLTTLQPRLDVPVVDAVDGRQARLRRDRLPAPLHLARSLASYGVLSAPDRARAIRGALALRSVDADAAQTDGLSFGQWLRQRGQSDRTIESLWDLVGVATINAHADDASLAVAATVFQIGLLTAADAADIGWSAVPLQRLHGDAATHAFDDLGVAVRLRTKVTALSQSAAGWVVGTDEADIDADAVVMATDHAAAERILPPDALRQDAGWSKRLGASPIVNVHLVFDRQVLTDPFLAGVRTPVQWVFDRTAASGLDASNGAQYVALSLSAADDLLGTSVADLRDTFVPELARLLPEVRAATILDFFVTREPRATFLAAPGTRAYRPQARTRLPGLVMAGAHTATGWPATMESAVRSGDLAAAAVLADRSPRSQVVAA